MIQNLNQVNFQGFGTVLPERVQAGPVMPKNAVQIKLPQPEAAVFRTRADTLLSCTGNMCVLLSGQIRHPAGRIVLLAERLQE